MSELDDTLRQQAIDQAGGAAGPVQQAIFRKGDPVRATLHPDGEEISGQVLGFAGRPHWVTVLVLGGGIRVVDVTRDRMVIDHARQVLFGVT